MNYIRDLPILAFSVRSVWCFLPVWTARILGIAQELKDRSGMWNEDFTRLL